MLHSFYKTSVYKKLGINWPDISKIGGLNLGWVKSISKSSYRVVAPLVAESSRWTALLCRWIATYWVVASLVAESSRWIAALCRWIVDLCRWIASRRIKSSKRSIVSSNRQIVCKCLVVIPYSRTIESHRRVAWSSRILSRFRGHIL